MTSELHTDSPFSFFLFLLFTSFFWSWDEKRSKLYLHGNMKITMKSTIFDVNCEENIKQMLQCASTFDSSVMRMEAHEHIYQLEMRFLCCWSSKCLCCLAKSFTQRFYFLNIPSDPFKHYAKILILLIFCQRYFR